jgi:hypothetical protein
MANAVNAPFTAQRDVAKDAGDAGDAGGASPTPHPRLPAIPETCPSGEEPPEENQPGKNNHEPGQRKRTQR